MRARRLRLPHPSMIPMTPGLIESRSFDYRSSSSTAIRLASEAAQGGDW